MKETYKYKAFISYSHQDQKFAKWLHKRIENYKIPKSLSEKYPNLPKDLKRTIFIDDEELPTASALPDNLSNALESSELLIVVCSPNATQSYWVDKEIAYFKHYHGEGKVLAVLKEGEPNATYSSVYNNKQEAFPKSLRYALNKEGELTEERTEPLAADARKRSNRKKALIKLIAGILKVDFADLWEREKKEIRKRRVIFTSILGIFIALSIYASVQFLGQQGNKELERINNRINMIEYTIRHDELPVEKVIALNKELKKLKVDKKNKEVSQEALGKLKTSLGQKAEKVYQEEGAKPAIKILTSQSALSNQESRLKDISKEKLALAKLYVETYEFEKAKESYQRAAIVFSDFENDSEYGNFLRNQGYFTEAIKIYEKLGKKNFTLSKQATIFSSLASLYKDTNQFSKSKKAFLEAIKIRKILADGDLSIYEPNLIISMNGLALLYQTMGQIDASEKLYNDVILRYRKIVTKNSDIRIKQAFSIALGSLGTFYSDTNKFKKSEIYHLEAFKILKSTKKINNQNYNDENYKLYLASIYSTLGLLYNKMHRLDESEDMYKRSLGLYNKLAYKNPNAYTSSVVMILRNLASTYIQNNKLKEAEEAYTRALKTYRSFVSRYPNVYSSGLASTLDELGNLYMQNNQFNEAEIVKKEALQLFRNLSIISPDVYSGYLANTLNNLANLYRNTNKYKDAETLYMESIELFRKLSKKNPQIYNPHLANTLTYFALLYMQENKFKKAEEIYKESLLMYRSLAEKYPIVFNSNLADTLKYIAFIYIKNTKYKEAKDAYDEALKLYRFLAKKTPNMFSSSLASTLTEIGDFYVDISKYKDAEILYSEASKLYENLSKVNLLAYNPSYALSLVKVANINAYTNQMKKAENKYMQALKILRPIVESNPNTYNQSLAQILDSFASIYWYNRQYKNAELLYEESLSLYQDLVQNNPNAYNPPYAITLLMLGNIYIDTNRIEKAEEVYKKSLQVFLPLIKTNPNVYNSYYSVLLHAFGGLHAKTNKFIEAEEKYLEVLGILRTLAKKNPDVYNANLAQTLHELTKLYGKENRFKEAEKIYREVFEIRKSLSENNMNVDGIDYAETLIMGVNILGKTKDNLLEAKEILKSFEDSPRAAYLLKTMDEI